MQNRVPRFDSGRRLFFFILDSLDLLIEEIFIIKNKDEFIEKGYLGIRDKKIVFVSDKPPELKVKERINRRDCIVSPGFFNTHTHIPMTLLRGVADDLPLMEWLEKYIWPLEGKLLSPSYVKAGTYVGILEMLKSGTIGFCDMYFFEEEIAQIIDEVGIYANLSIGILDFENPYYRDAEEALKKTERLMEGFKDHERIKVIPGPHAIYSCSRDTLLKSKELAINKGVSLHIHLSETRKEVEDSYKNFGKSPVFYLHEMGFFDTKLIAAHCVYLEDKEIELLKNKDFYVSHNLSSNLKLASGIMPFRKYKEHNLKITLGTDSASSNNNLDMLREMKIVSLIHKGIEQDPAFLKAKEVFYMATKLGAEALGFTDSGEIEEGKSADFVIIDPKEDLTLPFYDPYSYLIYSCTKSSIRDIMIKGKWILKDFEFKTLDKDRIIKESFEWKRKILSII